MPKLEWVVVGCCANPCLASPPSLTSGVLHPCFLFLVKGARDDDATLLGQGRSYALEPAHSALSRGAFPD